MEQIVEIKRLQIISFRKLWICLCENRSIFVLVYFLKFIIHTSFENLIRLAPFWLKTQHIYREQYSIINSKSVSEEVFCCQKEFQILVENQRKQKPESSPLLDKFFFITSPLEKENLTKIWSILNFKKFQEFCYLKKCLF